MLAFATTVGCLLHRLNNGLTLVLLPTQLAPVVAIQAWVSVGSADESIKQAGLSHVMEHMLFKGTERRGVGDIAREIELAGGEINAWTSRDSTVFHVVMPSRYADVGIDVLSDALTNSRFDAEELSREREVILEEIRQGNDEPLRALAQSMFAGAFHGHPYAKPVIGTPESVSKFRRSDLVGFRERWYRASNTAVVVAGNFEPEDMRRRIERHFADLPEGPAPRRPSRANKAVKRQTAHLETAAVSQSHLALSFCAPPIDTPECAALDLLTVAFGQGESSILHRDMVRKRELCKSAYAYLHALNDNSLVVLGATADPKRLDEALPILGAKIQNLRDTLVSSEALAKARHAIQADTVFQQETAEGAAQNAGSYMALVGDADFERSYLRRIAAVSPEDLRAAAASLFDPRDLNLAALLPEQSALGTPQKRTRAAKRMLAQVERGMKKATPKKISAKAKARQQAQAASKVLRRRLPNGMEVIIQRDSAVPIVAARAVWSGGQLLESDAKSGISELMAAVVTRGCGTRSAEDIIEEVDETAATLSGFAGRNSFGIRAEWLAKDWRRGFDLLSECLLAPTFAATEVERYKRRQLTRIDNQQHNPSHRAFRLLHETLYRKHPYRRNALGTPDTVRALDSRMLQKHYRKHYRVSDLTLAIVGDVDPEIVWSRVEARFAASPSTTRAARSTSIENFDGRSQNARTVFATMDREQAHLAIAFPGVAIQDKDRFALEVLTTILGGQGGRLFLTLRDEQSIAYQIGAYSLEGLDPGYVALYLSCAPEKVDQALAALRKEVESMVTGAVSSDELARSQRYLVGTHEISLQRRSSLASAMAFHNAYGLSYDDHLKYPQYIQGVTAADVQRVAKRIFDWDTAVTVTVAPSHASPSAEKRMRGKVHKVRRTGKAKPKKAKPGKAKRRKSAPKRKGKSL